MGDELRESTRGLRAALSMVRRFHDDVARCPTQPIVEGHLCGPLEDAADRVADVAIDLLDGYRHTGDQRYLRAHLIAEEASELTTAMARGSETGCLDALADLLYVVLGTAITLELPLPEAFAEVHASNMTKRRQADDPNGARVRAKGDDYRPPDLGRVLDEYRARTRDR